MFINRDFVIQLIQLSLCRLSVPAMLLETCCWWRKIDGISHCHLRPPLCKRGDIFRNHLRKHNRNNTHRTWRKDEHHSEEMSTSQSPDAHASFDRRNEFTHNHACMTNGISYDVDNPDTHFDKNSNTNSHRWRCAKCTKDFVSIKTLYKTIHAFTILSSWTESEWYSDDEIDGVFEVFESPPGTSQSTSGTSYPPKQETTVLVKMFQYLHSTKRIPVNIPSNYARSGYISDLPGPDWEDLEVRILWGVNLSGAIQITRKAEYSQQRKLLKVSFNCFTLYIYYTKSVVSVNTSEIIFFNRVLYRFYQTNV